MRRLAIAAAVIVLFGFGVLGWVGTRIYQEMPPIPDRVVSSDGTVVFDAGEIERGQNVWQSMGGMEVGSIWGHGSYVAPDWTADWLHRESGRILDDWANAERGRPYRDLDVETQAALGARLQALMRANRYDPATRTLTVEPVRAAAVRRALADYYADVFRDGRSDYAIPRGAVTDPARLHALAAFVFWTAWAAAAKRPGDGRQLHEQLAARAAGRQPPDG